MTRLGIITNVRAGRNRTRIERIREWVHSTDGEDREVEDLESIHEATTDLMSREIDILAVNGGDGTAQAVITELVRRGESLPDLAIVPGGTTNMTANDLNGLAPLEDALRSLTEQASRSPDTRTRVSRPLVHARAPGIDSQYGLFLGAGLVLRGMKHFRDHVGAMGLRGELAAGISLIRGLAGVARGRGPWSETARVTVRIGEQADPWQQQILVVATTLERLLLGSRPWWGEQIAPIHLTALRQAPRSLIRSAPALMKGRRHPRLSAKNGYRSENVDAFTLQSIDEFALDGQIFKLSADQSVVVRATIPVNFLSL